MRLVLCEQHQRNERSVAPHRHPHTEWHFAVAGRCGFDIGEQQTDFATGDLLMIPARLPHRLCVRSSGEWIVQILIATEPESAEDETLLKAFDTSRKVHVGSHRHAFFAGLAADLASRNPFRRRGAGLRFTALLCDLAGGTEASSSPVVERALALMRSRLDRSLSLSEIVQAAGCGRSLLARRFRTEVGEPPLAHFLGMRLDLGADLLRQGGRAVHEVATACGFDDPYHFSRCFRRRFGRPPSAWGQS